MSIVPLSHGFWHRLILKYVTKSAGEAKKYGKNRENVED
jgi:hypothetical protein